MIKVLNQAFYLSNESIKERSSREYAATAYILCIKGDFEKRTTRGKGYYGILPNGQKVESADKSTHIRAHNFFADWILERINALIPNGQVHLITIPGSKCINPESPTILRDVAKIVEAKSNGRIRLRECLWQKVPREPRRKKNGRRLIAKDYDDLVFRDGRQGVSMDQVVLLDDTLVSGSMIGACSALLKENGITPKFALCAVAATNEKKDVYFTGSERDINDVITRFDKIRASVGY